jgi:hypothetical protein
MNWITIVFSIGMFLWSSLIPTAGGNQPAPSDAPTIDVAGLGLKLGMDKESILKRIPGQFRVENTGASVLIEDKAHPSQVYGSLSFVDRKLSRVDKNWNVSGETEADFARALYGVISEFQHNRRTQCQIAAGEGKPINPADEIKSARIFCGEGSYIDITFVNTSAGKYGNIYEVLGPMQ